MPAFQTSVVLSLASEAAFTSGRAGMLYRDLVPDRQGGAVVASHIRIEAGGAVPDYVHHHEVRFQAIYCYKGWVRVVYEDQGPPFLLMPGDCVLQPPGIRHRVLESSPGLEVVEVASPADHATLADHDLVLPTATPRPQRTFAGQPFVRHEAATADWRPWRLEGFQGRDTGIAAATDGLASVACVRPIAPTARLFGHDADFLFLFVLRGSLTLDASGRGRHRLAAADAVVMPSALRYAFLDCSADLELLEVAWPAVFRTLRAEDASVP